MLEPISLKGKPAGAKPPLTAQMGRVALREQGIIKAEFFDSKSNFDCYLGTVLGYESDWEFSPSWVVVVVPRVLPLALCKITD